MQDRYIGDVGDFAKYALLRRLCGLVDERLVRLGIVWCRFANESHNSDGRHTSYLYSSKYLDLDNELLLALRNIVATGKRLISSVSGAGVFFPTGTVFCDAPISALAPDRLPRDQHIRYRSAWLASCLGQTKDCELVFFDPDNGLEIASIPKHHPKAGKYIYWDELTPFWRRGNALLIYHHLNRTASSGQQVEALTRRFAASLDRALITPLVFRRGSSRVFWLIHNGSDLGRELESRAADLLNGGWSGHFRPFGWPGNDQAGRSTP